MMLYNLASYHQILLKESIMRTTLTIDDSIIQKLKEEAHRSGLPFKKIVNMTLEQGLKQLHEKPRTSKYRLKTFHMGFPPKTDLNKALQIASTIEDEEIARKLEMHK